MEVKVIFPPHEAAANIQTLVCAASMRSTRTKEPAHELLKEFTMGCKSTTESWDVYLSRIGVNQEVCEKCGSRTTCATYMLRKAKKMKHWGVLEHATFTVSVSEISRSLTHQLVRHRIASYLQQSLRQVDPSENLTLCPESVKVFQGKPYDLEVEYSRITENARDFYRKLVNLGIPKEDARFVLPIGTKTHIVVTMNAHSWLHFFKLRLDKHAQWEIREMAQLILDEFIKLAPLIFEGAGELDI